MTDKDVDQLCCYLSQLSMEELQSLNLTGILPRVAFAGTTQCGVVTSISCTLKADSPLEKRLQLVTWIYCWLIPHDKLNSWTLYRFTGLVVEAGDFTLHAKITTAFCSPNTASTFVPLGCEVGRYACLMTREPESEIREHCVICFCAWVGMPYLAVRAVGVQNEQSLRSSLKVHLKGDLDELAVGHYPELSDAFAAALRHQQVVCNPTNGSPTTSERRLQPANDDLGLHFDNIEP